MRRCSLTAERLNSNQQMECSIPPPAPDLASRSTHRLIGHRKLTPPDVPIPAVGVPPRERGFPGDKNRGFPRRQPAPPALLIECGICSEIRLEEGESTYEEASASASTTSCHRSTRACREVRGDRVAQPRLGALGRREPFYLHQAPDLPECQPNCVGGSGAGDFCRPLWLYWPSTHGGFLKVDDAGVFAAVDAVRTA